MQHPFDNPEIAAASQLRGCTGPVFQALVPAANVECKSKDAPCRPAPGRFCLSVFAPAYDGRLRNPRQPWVAIPTPSGTRPKQFVDAGGFHV